MVHPSIPSEEVSHTFVYAIQFKYVLVRTCKHFIYVGSSYMPSKSALSVNNLLINSSKIYILTIDDSGTNFQFPSWDL